MNYPPYASYSKFICMILVQKQKDRLDSVAKPMITLKSKLIYLDNVSSFLHL